MSLKRVEIAGFKSFPDRVTLEIGSGITAIVGPNGSGKSNLVDAIRWVLGEANPRELRGLRMEDMIFSGCETRRPLSWAEVSLTFDNSSGWLPVDYSEVTVTRRLYRDGSGEHFLNRIPCRLRDAQELFYDTGMARDGYALVGQGKVEQILSARPEERRALFEEAAGIVKSKQRKKEALARLEASARDMERVSDLLAELESQLGLLAEEARRAQEWERYRQERDVILLVLAWREREKLALAWRETREACARLQEEFSALQERAARLGEEEAAAQAEREDRQEAWRKKQEELLALSGQVAEAERECSRWEERVASLEAETDRLRGEGERLAAGKETVRPRLEQARRELEAWSEKSGGEAEELQARERELREQEESCQRLAAAWEQGKARLIDLLGELAAARNRLASLESECRHLAETWARLRAREREIARVLREAEEDVLVLTGQAGGIRQRRGELEEELASLRQQLRAVQSARAREEAALREAEAAYQQAKARWQALRELEEGYEGFARGPRALLQACRERPGLFPGVIGPVSGLLGVSEEYEAAVEAALGSALQDIVVRTAEDAEKAIGYLKATQAGWATFLPLDTLRPAGLGAGERAHLRLPGVLGVASDLVTFLPEHRPAVEFLLGRTVVARDLPAALSYARGTGFRVKVVTLEGDIVSPGGSMAGGWRKAPRSGIWRRAREMSRWEKQLGELEAARAERQRAWEEAAATAERQAQRLAGLGEELRQLELYQAGLEKELEGKKAERERCAGEAASLEMELQAIQERLAAREAELGRVREQVDRLERERQAQEAAVAALGEELARSQERKQAAEQEAVALRIALSGRQEALARLQEAVFRAEQELISLSRQEEEWRASLTSRARELEQAREARGRWQSEREAVRARRQELEEEVGKLGQEVHHLSKRLSVLERMRRQAQRQREEAGETLHKQQLEETRLSERLREAEDKLRLRFGCEPERAGELATSVSWWSREDGELRARAEELEGALAALEPVNPAAGREYARLKERHEFLSTQRRDLEEARADLTKVIAQLDREMAEKFSRAFAQAREMFRLVFAEMFGGGKADLLLTDPSDPLQAGVEIVAQPPGKKLQHLSLLSGGERTLCAIALLFALLRTRPSRFCIFDEVDANLDEANVERFARFLRELSSRAQFLVVTHQKGTMEAADVLYGVTMEESGVSKIVSLRLAEMPAT